MKKSNAGQQHVNSLNFSDRIKLVDWLRAERDVIPTRTVEENVEAAKAHIGRSCSAQQLRDLAKAADVPWRPQLPARTGGGAAGSRRYQELEARVKMLEQWCEQIATSLDIPKPTLPSDEDLQE